MLAVANQDGVQIERYWGIHFEPGTIADYQYEAAHAAIDAGADVILGHHGHVIKGVEYYRGKPFVRVNVGATGGLSLYPFGAVNGPFAILEPAARPLLLRRHLR